MLDNEPTACKQIRHELDKHHNPRLLVAPILVVDDK